MISNIEKLRLMNMPDEDLLRANITSLEKEANMAIAWGIPDSECTGYSSREFINIIRKQQHMIQILYGRLSSRGC